MIIIVLVLIFGYFLVNKYNTPSLFRSLELPEGIPIENENVLESVITDFPEQNARQLSISYESRSTVAQKYSEYKDYMRQHGYKFSEGREDSPIRAVFGKKDGVNLSVAVSNNNGKTLIQLSYLVTAL